MALAAVPVAAGAADAQVGDGIVAEAEAGTLRLDNRDGSDYYYVVEHGEEAITSRIGANAEATLSGFAPGTFAVRASTSPPYASGDPVPVNGRETYTFDVGARGREGATPIAAGDYVDETSVDAGVADHWYALDAAAGQSVKVVHTSVGADVALYDEAGEELAAADGRSEGSAVGATMERAGTCYLNVRGSGLPDFSYGASVYTTGPDGYHPNDGPDAAAVVSPGEEVRATVASRESDWFAVDADAGERLTATLRRRNVKVGIGNDLEVAILSPDGAAIGEHPAAYCAGRGTASSRTSTNPGCVTRDAASQTAVAPADGTHYVRVSGFDHGGDGPFEYSVQGFADYALAVEREAGAGGTEESGGTDDSETDDSGTTDSMSTLTVTKSGEPRGLVAFTLTVTGEIRRTDSSEAVIEGDTAIDWVGPNGGTDTVEFTGEIERFVMKGDAAKVLVDGERVDPGEL